MNKKINLVLSGGGARGIAHIGVIELLQEKGYEIQSVSGTSMGGLVGGVYAAQALTPFKEWLINADIKEAIKILDFSLSLPGLIKGEKIMHKIDRMLAVKNIEDLPLPYTAVSTDLTTDRAVYFQEGNLLEAMRATIAIPTIFTPVIKDKHILVDGGLVNNIPINIAKTLNNYPVVAVCVNADVSVTQEQIQIMKPSEDAEKEYLNKLDKIQKHIKSKLLSKTTKKDPKMSYSKILDQTIHLMISQISNQIIATYPPDILINIPRKICGTFDFLKAEKLIKIGRMAAAEHF